MITKRFFKTRDDVEVTFQIDAHGAESAALVADIHDWRPQPMTRSARGRGPFRLKLRVPRDGSIQFRYLLDGVRWENDDAADAYWPNALGTDNSVVVFGG
ncbi:MAG: isoamylase early set domain-containing protein [Actinobacteria bacterium]|nr:isoamylase early set domain-containing protein [Actinomycetota bacterium]